MRKVARQMAAASFYDLDTTKLIGHTAATVRTSAINFSFYHFLMQIN